MARENVVAWPSSVGGTAAIAAFPGKPETPPMPVRKVDRYSAAMALPTKSLMPLAGRTISYCVSGSSGCAGPKLRIV